MKTILTYYHTRDLFIKNEFKPFVKKYFKDVEFIGTESGNWSPSISISNWEDVKNDLPKYAIPISVKFDKSNITIVEALSSGQLGLARELRGENNTTIKTIRAWK